MKYLVAVDGSATSHKAFLKAVSLYKETDTIVLLVVVDLVHYMMSNPNLDTTTIADIKKEMFENGHKLIQKYEDLAKNDYLINNVEAILNEGTPRDQIVKIVDEKAIDILCIGRVGLINSTSITMGSTSEYCIRNCSCDILVCR